MMSKKKRVLNASCFNLIDFILDASFRNIKLGTNGMKILNYLFDKGALSYTDLMTTLKMNPSRDAGKFAYHLKFLLEADLVEADSN